MGSEQSILKKKGYITEKEDPLIVTKGDDKFFIKKIMISGNAAEKLNSEIQFLKDTSNPHIVSCKDFITEQNISYVVMDYCQGGNLATKIKEMKHPLQESEVLSWIVEICIALRAIHEKDLLHKALMSENVFLTEFGIVCLGGFGKVHECSKQIQSTTNSKVSERINHLAPEVFTGSRTYDEKSDIWSVGCILYELCTQQMAFSAETTVQLMPKIISGPYPSLPGHFSSDLRELMNDIFKSDPQSRPTASEILQRPFILSCLKTKTKATMKELQTKVEGLRTLADGLERVHQGTTIGSLAGGVIGAVGGITSIVGLILAPFTLGTSLIVTGVGVGVSVAGGATAGISNVTKMVNESSDRTAVRSIIKETAQKINAVVTWLQEISKSLQTLRSKYGTLDTRSNTQTQENLASIGVRAGRGLGGVAELVRLVQVMNVGKIAAQATRAIRVAETATGVLSGLFVAVDIFFIAMDAKEIHRIKQAQAARQGATSGSRLPVSETEDNDLTTFDNAELLIQDSEHDTSNSQDQTPQTTTEIRSEIMKFVQSIREAADKLQNVLDELNSIIQSIASFGNDNELEFQDMELM